MAYPAANAGADRSAAREPAFWLLLRLAGLRAGKPDRGRAAGLPLHRADLHRHAADDPGQRLREGQRLRPGLPGSVFPEEDRRQSRHLHLSGAPHPQGSGQQQYLQRYDRLHRHHGRGGHGDDPPQGGTLRGRRRPLHHWARRGGKEAENADVRRPLGDHRGAQRRRSTQRANSRFRV